MGGWFFLLGNDTGFAFAFLLDLGGSVRSPNPLRPRIFVSVFFEIFIEPTARLASRLNAKLGVHFKIRPRLESPDSFLSTSQNGQRRRLDPTCRSHLKTTAALIERSECTSGIDAD